MGITVGDIAQIDSIGSTVTCVEQGLGASVVRHAAPNQSREAALTQVPFGAPQTGMVERTLSPRVDIIARLHDLLAQLSGIPGAHRHGDDPACSHRRPKR
ncbi:hypothetical protein [Paracoccus spongiarum]|uniref:hypothetical protein n=1 Tax=Paracoccus spongiarum TaxID=3064387 RepID=UPI00353253AC